MNLNPVTRLRANLLPLTVVLAAIAVCAYAALVASSVRRGRGDFRLRPRPRWQLEVWLSGSVGECNGDGPDCAVELIHMGELAGTSLTYFKRD